MRHDRDDSAFLALGEKYAATTVLVRWAASPEEPGCTGTLIDPSWVLTAAHVATDLTRGDFADVAGEVHLVDRVVLHPEWHGNADFKVDIALVRLAKPVTTVAPAQIYRLHDELNAVVTFAGRGGNGTGLTGPVEEDRKLRGATNRVELAEGSILKFRFDRPEDAQVTELEGISGPGDSGGPAYLQKNDVLYVIGISSSQDNRPAGRMRGHYGVLEYYVRVSHFADWIRTVVIAN